MSSTPARRPRLLALVVVALVVSACGLVSSTAPPATPTDFPGLAGRLHAAGIDVSNWVSGDAGCTDPDLVSSGVSFDALLKKQDATYGAFAWGRRDLHLPMPVLKDFVGGLKSSPPTARAGQTVTGVEDLDGVKLLFGGKGWLLHRLSGTEPIIRIYAEHEDRKVVDSLLAETEANLRQRASAST